MSSMFEVIRKIVDSEIGKLNIAELGVVTSIFPHSNDSDKENYSCNVKLKYRDLELRMVPVATQHIGLANTPNIGDLVLLNFVNGNINAPVIVGRLYTDEDRPPVSKEEEIVYIPPYSKTSGLRRIHVELSSGMVFSITDDDVTVEAGKTTLKLNRDGDIDIQSAAKINVQANGDLSFSADNIKMESQKNIEIKAGAGDLSISAINIKSESQGTMEYKAGTTAELNASGPLTIKGAIVNINP